MHKTFSDKRFFEQFQEQTNLISTYWYSDTRVQETCQFVCKCYKIFSI